MTFYPLYSAINADFRPSKILDRAGAALSAAQYQRIKRICFRDVDATTNVGDRLMKNLKLVAYTPLSLALVSSIVPSGIKTNHADSPLHRRMEALGARMPRNVKAYLPILGLPSIPSSAAGLLWTVLRSRQAQIELAGSLGNEENGSKWAFGWVAAVTLLAPVMFEWWNAFVLHWRGPDRGWVETVSMNGKDNVTSPRHSRGHMPF